MGRLRGGMAAAEDVRVALQREVPGAYWLKTESLEEVVSRARRSWRLGAGMFTAFGVLALLVAGVGLYGAIAYDLAQRTHEMGVRTALGASRATLLRLVLRRSVAWTLAGLCAGATISVLAARWIQPFALRPVRNRSARVRERRARAVFPSRSSPEPSPPCAPPAPTPPSSSGPSSPRPIRSRRSVPGPVP